MHSPADGNLPEVRSGNARHAPTANQEVSEHFMKLYSPTTTFLLGLWLGGSLFLVAVVTYNFVGIKPSFEANEELRTRAGFDPDDEAAKKTSVIWVFASELNRAFFGGWNRLQLGLGLLVLAGVVTRCPRRAALISTALAVGIVLVLTFYLAPQLVEIGRGLDFKPRDPEPPGLAEFNLLHRVYSGLAVAKGVLLILTFLFVMPGYSRAETPGT